MAKPDLKTFFTNEELRMTSDKKPEGYDTVVSLVTELVKGAKPVRGEQNATVTKPATSEEIARGIAGYLISAHAELDAKPKSGKPRTSMSHTLNVFSLDSKGTPFLTTGISARCINTGDFVRYGLSLAKGNSYLPVEPGQALPEQLVRFFPTLQPQRRRRV